MDARQSSTIVKENMAKAPITRNKRRGDEIKPLQEKNDLVEDTRKENKKERNKDTVEKTKNEKDRSKDTVEDTRKRKEKENGKSVGETKPTVSYISTRNMGERRNLPERNVHMRQKKTSRTQTTTNVQSLKKMPFIKTRSMVALTASSQKSTLKKLKKRGAAIAKFESKAPTESTGKEAIKEEKKISSKKGKSTGNSSAEPVYKKKLDDNVSTTVDSIFDFESNSQEITATSDEPMKDVIEKLVRENKAVVKHKAIQNKAATGAKERVVRGRVAKQRVNHREASEKIVTMPISKLREVIQSSLKSINRTQNESPVIKKSLKRPRSQKGNVYSEDISEIVDLENVAVIVDSKDVVTSSLKKQLSPPPKPYKAHSTPKSIAPQYQSTPFRQTSNSQVSPWRVRAKELLSASSMASELSKVDQIHKTKDMKENEEKIIEQTLAELQQSITDDIKNCFGFNVDDCNDEDGTVLKTLPKPIPKVKASLPKSKFSVIETAKSGQQELKQPVDNCLTTMIGKLPPTLFEEPPTTPNKIINKQSNQVKMNRKKVTLNGSDFQKFSIPHESDNTAQKPSSSSSIGDAYVVPLLFETNWPTREDKKHRSYTRVPQRNNETVMTQNNESLMTDDESETEELYSQRRHKRTKQDPKLQEELRKFEEEFNSSCKEFENYNLVMEPGD